MFAVPGSACFRPKSFFDLALATSQVVTWRFRFKLFQVQSAFRYLVVLAINMSGTSLSSRLITMIVSCRNGHTWSCRHFGHLLPRLLCQCFFVQEWLHLELPALRASFAKIALSLVTIFGLVNSDNISSDKISGPSHSSTWLWPLVKL